jgi:hypothetical protein
VPMRVGQAKRSPGGYTICVVSRCKWGKQVLRSGAALVFLLLVVAAEAAGQIASPVLDRHEAGLGYAYLWFHRNMEHYGTPEFRWEVDAVRLTYGVTNRITVMGEGAVWNLGERGSDEGRNYRFLHVGAGAAMRLMRLEFADVVLNLSCAESFWFDLSESRYHKRTTSIVGTLAFDRTFEVYGQSVGLRGGPAFESDEYVEYPWGTTEVVRWTSVDDFGFTLGGNVLFLGHVDLWAQMVYTGYAQPRLGISLRP